jgi:hypothetical protein
MSKQPSITKEFIFPLIVLVLSGLTLGQHFLTHNIQAAIVAVIGIVGCVLFYFKNRYYKLLFFIWIIVQMLVITSIVEVSAGLRMRVTYWDATQNFSLKFGFTVGSATKTTTVQVNVLAFIFLGFFRLLRVSGLVGARLTFTKFKADSVFGDALPVTGTVLKRVVLGDEKDWLLVQLDAPVLYNQNNINTVLVKRKDGGVLRTKAANQIIYFRLVDNPQDINDNAGAADFPFLEWVVCK